jgi:hypothetical protein
VSDEDKVYEEFEDYCKEVTAAAIAWEARWPNACKSCYGRGGHGWTEMHGFTHGAGEQMYDICSCVEQGNCPRCGTVAWSVDNEIETPCPTCGWNWCKGSDDACPEI